MITYILKIMTHSRIRILIMSERSNNIIDFSFNVTWKCIMLTRLEPIVGTLCEVHKKLSILKDVCNPVKTFLATAFFFFSWKWYKVILVTITPRCGIIQIYFLSDVLPTKEFIQWQRRQILKGRLSPSLHKAFPVSSVTKITNSCAQAENCTRGVIT